MASIAESLRQISDLTKKNLQILSMINQAFFSKKSHITTNIDGTMYIIPSFVEVENKINTLQNDLENLVSSSKTGTAYLSINDNTQKIQLMGYSNAPYAVSLDETTNFNVESNNIFKDFLTPNPYLKFNLTSIPNNICDVNVKKVVIKNPELLRLVQGSSSAATKSIAWGDLAGHLYLYEKGVDYIEYDTIKHLPIKQGVAYGVYDIEEIEDHYQDPQTLENYYKVRVNHELTYTIQDNTIEKPIRAGDRLLTNNDNIQLEVVETYYNSNEMLLKVKFGAYANLTPTSSQNPDLYRLKYYKPTDYNDYKYIKVTLEEDPYICVFISPINNDTNVQAPWGNGLFVNVDLLTYEEDGVIYGFRNYYKYKVNNVGDTLFGLTSMIDNTINNYTKAEFEAFTNYMPTINPNKLQVIHINKHLDESSTVKEIRNLYAQKADYKSKLEAVQQNIDNVTDLLNELAFNDTTSNRTIYESTLNDLNIQKSNLVQSINSTIQEISNSANNSVVPLENAKYRIRGYVETTLPDTLPDYDKRHVIKLDYEYRYKNKNLAAGNAVSIDNDFIFSDWNRGTNFYDMKQAYIDSHSYEFKYPTNNDNVNEPSFNQIDIPISQGEQVDVRVRFVYDLGYPFVEVTSEWSDYITVEFPLEFTTNVSVLDIIDENNDDIKKQQFEGILSTKGIIEHVDNKIVDQNIVYYHSANNIPSGFYTDERRVISLADKLSDFDAAINDLLAEVYGSASSNLIITLTDGEQISTIQPNITNNFIIKDFDSNTDKEAMVGNYGRQIAYSPLKLNIYNAGSYAMKLHSLFPGDYTSDLSSNYNSNAQNYINQDNDSDNGRGVWMLADSLGSANIESVFPRQNQFIYFRLNDAFNTSKKFYGGANNNEPPLFTGNTFREINNNKGALYPILDDNNIGSFYDTSSGTSTFFFGSVFPYIGQLSTVCIESGDSYKTIQPGESVDIPLSAYYSFRTTINETTPGNPTPQQPTLVNPSANMTMSFDIRTSLYKDPINYKINFVFNSKAKLYSKIQKKLKNVADKATNVTLATNDAKLVRDRSIQNKRRM